MTDQRYGGTDQPLEPVEDEVVTDRPSGWTGADDDQGGTMNRPAGPDYGASPLDDETPGSQGEIESGSEGDFGGPTAVEDRPAGA